MDIASYLLANTYSAFSPGVNMAQAYCTINNQLVPCPIDLSILGPMLGFIWFIGLAVFVIMIVSLWKVFTKASQPGWASIIPIYNIIVLLQITKKPIWWIILMFIPIVSLVISIIVMHELSKSFGKGVGFTIGLLLLPFIFYPMLAFGDARYQYGNQPAPQM